jgi:hypothetical protein
MVKRPQDRHEAVAVWQPGSLGPYGAGPTRPSEFTIEPSDDLTAGVIGFAAVFLFVILATPIVIIVLIVRFVRRRISGWTSALQAQFQTSSQAPSPSSPSSASVRKQLEIIRQTDPDFSVVLLEDFLYALYTEAQTARGQKATDRLSPYLGKPARTQLDQLGALPVSGVVVGVMRFTDFSVGKRQRLTIEIEANYAEKHPDGVRGYYTREIWTLVRDPAARSRPPDRVRTFGCPGCGAPLDRLMGSTCQYCNRVVDGGNYDWMVVDIKVCERARRGPMLTGTVEEEGTEQPTTVDPNLTQALQNLRSKDSTFEEKTFEARVGFIFQTMQKAWSTLQWEDARPLLSDNLFEAQNYWITAYKTQGLRNITEDARITTIEIVRITEDRWFTAMTVRLHATGRDYTIRAKDGQVVGGSQSKERRYTEYWTLIRGSQRTGASRSDATCPNCSAPLEVNMAAVCNYCKTKVNSGAFDWVLSRIEQDEVYAG